MPFDKGLSLDGINSSDPAWEATFKKVGEKGEVAGALCSLDDKTAEQLNAAGGMAQATRLGIATPSVEEQQRELAKTREEANVSMNILKVAHYDVLEREAEIVADEAKAADEAKEATKTNK